MSRERTYFCIDMKSFYASVECAERGLNPFETNLVVADLTRGKNALCLAISPKMKTLGIKNRCRLSEIPKEVEYITATPRMHFYIEYAADIYGIYLDYFDPSDIHVYSIDESFIDATNYLALYKTDAKSLAKRLMNEIAEKLHIPAAAGIGTNLFLAKVALDISAKNTADHIGYLTEELFKKTLWEHRPITDFWQIAKGTENRLKALALFTMKDIAFAPPEILYRTFGINAELLIDHAWGRESCLMEDIKSYKGKSRSVSFSQILPRDYTFEEARIVLKEMVLSGSQELMKRRSICGKVWVGVGYSGEMHESTHASSHLENSTAVYSLLLPAVLEIYDRVALRSVKIRRLGIDFSDVCDENCEGYSLFTDTEKLEKEKAKEHTILELKQRFGKNAVLRGTNLLSCATQKERNEMIGGHRAGYDDPKRKS